MSIFTAVAPAPSAVEPARRDPNRALVARPATLPNLVTIARTVAAVPLALIAAAGAVQHSAGGLRGGIALLAAAYAVYWIGDIADGHLARRLGQETRLGAVLDIVCDRACSAALAVALVALRPDLLVVMAVFLLNFMVLDLLLSLAFLCWPIDSPNDFHRVDPRLYRWNWSPPAKAANTAGVLLVVAIGGGAAGFVVAVGLLLVKVWSAGRMIALLAR